MSQIPSFIKSTQFVPNVLTSDIVMNGRQQAPGAFLLESAVLKKSGVTLRRAIHHMDVEIPEAHSESFFDLELDLLGDLESDGSDNHDNSGGY